MTTDTSQPDVAETAFTTEPDFDANWTDESGPVVVPVTASVITPAVRHAEILAECSYEAGRAIQERGDEFLKSAAVDDELAIVRFRRKYGNQPGTRTVTLSRISAGEPWQLDNETFKADKLERRVEIERVVETTNRPDVLAEMAARRVADEKLDRGCAPDPSDHISQQNNASYHVRSTGDRRVICDCRSLTDALRIASLYGAEIWTYQHLEGTGYRDWSGWTPEIGSRYLNS